MEVPLVTVIVLNYNGGDVTQECLNSVLKSDYSNLEIILVDNNSACIEQQTLKQKYKDGVRLIFSKENLGYTGGNNLGAKRASGKYLVFLNNDTVVSKGWLHGIIERMEQNPKIAFLQPKIKWLKNKQYFEYAGGAGGFIDFFGYPFVRGRIFGTVEEDVGQYDDEREIFWASGVALFCRKKVFVELGQFDTRFFAHAEEEDLCFRAHRSGYKVLYFPKSVVCHLGAFADGRDPFRRTFLKHRNHLFLLFKNLRLSDLILILPMRLVMDFSTTIYYIVFFRSLNMLFAVFLAYFSFFGNLPKLLESRRKDKIGNFGYPKNSAFIYGGSVVFRYFLLRKKRWSEIYNKSVSGSKIIKIF